MPSAVVPSAPIMPLNKKRTEWLVLLLLLFYYYYYYYWFIIIITNNDNIAIRSTEEIEWLNSWAVRYRTAHPVGHFSWRRCLMALRDDPEALSFFPTAHQTTAALMNAYRRSLPDRRSVAPSEYASSEDTDEGEGEEYYYDTD